MTVLKQTGKMEELTLNRQVAGARDHDVSINLGEFCKKADIAIYEAKKPDKNLFQVCEGHTQEHEARRVPCVAGAAEYHMNVVLNQSQMPSENPGIRLIPRADLIR